MLCNSANILYEKIGEEVEEHNIRGRLKRAKEKDRKSKISDYENYLKIYDDLGNSLKKCNDPDVICDPFKEALDLWNDENEKWKIPGFFLGVYFKNRRYVQENLEVYENVCKKK